MTLVLAAAILFSVFIVWMVTTPLFSAENMESFSASYKGFADEAELRQALQLRDKLLGRLVHGRVDDERVSGLSEADCFQALVSLSLRLQRADLPYLPEKQGDTLTNPQSGRVSLKMLFALALVAIGVGFGLKAATASAQMMSHPPTASAPVNAPATLFQIEPSVYAPQASRYMISPAQGHLVGLHLTSFSVPVSATEGVTVVLPLPEGIRDWQLTAMRPEALANQVTAINWKGSPALQLPPGTQGLAVELNSEFKLRAFTGHAVWKNTALPPLPGEQIAVLFEAPSPLSTLFGRLMEGWNVWPPRILKVGEGMNLQNREVAMNPSLPARKVQIVSRASDSAAAYLNFEVIGLAPDRLPLIVLGSLIGAILFGVGAFVLFRGARWRIDRSEALPG
ncbi:MAG: hypothetical protein RI932_1740 [Pseudomonadota bacterium]|jgi:hypothetical protein